MCCESQHLEQESVNTLEDRTSAPSPGCGYLKVMLCHFVISWKTSEPERAVYIK